MYVLYKSTCRRLCKYVVGCRTILFYFPVPIVMLYNYRRASLFLTGQTTTNTMTLTFRHGVL